MEFLNLSTPFQILSLCPIDKSITVAENIREKILEKYGEWVEVYRNNSYTFHNVEEKVKANANNYVSSVHECIGDMLKDA